jgi:uracil-DNA glycosylase
VKVVIIGQDPYHGEGQAHGLAFSVKPGVAIPPSLLNIYKELKQEYNLPLPVHGHLLAWAQQGVFLLNQVLTVEKAKPASHQGRGWEFFTDQVVRVLSEKKTHLVFVLWGAQAQKKRELIDEKKHLILTSPHPSPLSAHRGFMGNNHFKKINQFLKQHHQVEIDWSLSEQSAESQTLPRK